jgi:3-dehydroquinate synthase
MAPAQLIVESAESAYPVIIQPGALIDALPRFVIERGFKQTAVITNTTLAPLYGQALAARLPGGFVITVPDGEQYKNLDSMQRIYTRLLEGGADRGTLIVALGGGVIGDMAGFAAATFMRGIAFVQAPTSLLAMVDASIGGKVGIDLPQGKNLVGAFKDPLGVFADTITLQTLPPVELRCGLAEAVKSALVGDPALLDVFCPYQPDRLEEIIARSAAVKIKLVEIDRLEKGPRAYLNLGHTFGHAIEQASGYAWKHGEGVALGLVAAARLSEQRELCPPGVAESLEQILSGLGLPVRYDHLSPADLWDAMRHDKKWQEGTARFVLLSGEDTLVPVVVSDVTRAEVLAVLEGLREDA